MIISERDKPIVQELRFLIALQTDCSIQECDECRLSPDIYCGCESDAIKLIEKIRSNAKSTGKDGDAT